MEAELRTLSFALHPPFRSRRPRQEHLDDIHRSADTEDEEEMMPWPNSYTVRKNGVFWSSLWKSGEVFAYFFF